MEKFQFDLNPGFEIPNADVTPSPMDELFARGLLIDHLDVQELYVELIQQSQIAPIYQYHETRSVMNLRLNWLYYTNVETVDHLHLISEIHERALVQE